MTGKRMRCILLILLLSLTLSCCRFVDSPLGEPINTSDVDSGQAGGEASSFSIENIPEFSDEPYVVIDNNIPKFSEDIAPVSFERYSELDSLGRCGVAYACVAQDLMPTEERGSIGQIKPSGWQTVKYESVDGKYLYNRCHLIGFQLTGENANEQNLITGTRYMNVNGMLPFENMVADYIKETGNHVLYRVTPIYNDYNLVASGVQMEALSIEDDGEGICFNVYCYNSQPGIIIDYSNGDSQIDESAYQDDIGTYILNTNSRKFHASDCPLAEDIKESNRQEYTGSRKLLIEQGFSPCKSCDP